MMKYLVDTHALLWYLEDNPKLSTKAIQLIKNPQNLICVNIVSFWEIAIKNALGKLELSKMLTDVFVGKYLGRFNR